MPVPAGGNLAPNPRSTNWSYGVCKGPLVRWTYAFPAGGGKARTKVLGRHQLVWTGNAHRSGHHFRRLPLGEAAENPDRRVLKR